MKNEKRIYILEKEDEKIDIVCASDNISDIRKSICKDFCPDTDYPVLEIWKDGNKVNRVSGSDVLATIVTEIREKDKNNSSSLVTELSEVLEAWYGCSHVSMEDENLIIVTDEYNRSYRIIIQETTI